MKIRHFSIIAAASLLTAGCATIFTGTTQTIHVRAVDMSNNQLLSGANCQLTDGNGRIYDIAGNPGTAVVSKGQGAMSAQCIKPGYQQKQVGVGENFNSVTLINILFWPGFIVDAVTGTIQKYPSYVNVVMTRAGK